MTSSRVNEIQIGGDHYKTAYQHWDMIVSLGMRSESFIYQVTKYISRWRKKNGVRDLQKGKHFAEKLLELVDKHGKSFLMFSNLPEAVLRDTIVKHVDAHLNDYFKANEIGEAESAICVGIIFANSAERIRAVIEVIDQLIREAVKEEQKTGVRKADAEPPVSRDYEFIEYTEHDTIRWKKKATGEILDLCITMPPMRGHWAA